MKFLVGRRKRPVFLCHGCFDFLHVGHLSHLVQVWQQARRVNGLVYVTLTADRFVNKGPGRPLVPEGQRAAALGLLPFVDRVEIVHEASGVWAIQTLKPRFYCKGPDYRGRETSDPKFIAEIDALTRVGGELFFTTGEIQHSSDYLERYRKAWL